MLTKLFKSGNSQAVRIPKEMQFKVKEVDISRVGNSIIITEIHDNWDNVFKSLDQAHDFLIMAGINLRLTKGKLYNEGDVRYKYLYIYIKRTTKICTRAF